MVVLVVVLRYQKWFEMLMRDVVIVLVMIDKECLDWGLMTFFLNIVNSIDEISEGGKEAHLLAKRAKDDKIFVRSLYIQGE